MTPTARTTLARPREAGATLLYVLMAIPVVLVALMSMGAVIVGTSRHQSQTRSTTTAVTTIEQKIAEIQALANTDMGAVYATYTDPQNQTFAVPPVPGVHDGLTPLPGETTVGRIACWNDETGATVPAGALPTDAARLGLPLDLNMDDDALDDDVTSFDLKVVPVKITLDYLDATGPRHIELYHLFAAEPR